MRFWVYILQSRSSGRYYCGQTSDVGRRVRQHNDPEYQQTRTTKVMAGPWELVWSKGCSSRAAAMELEKRIKKRGIARFL
ncbi:MAG: GIY-YIG nuclease family protein, partial [Deltaproteobacteria bacterium]|nr:GIY-YIG nuclease family protein [Deltaproteobacteria bacterium]